MAGRDQANTGRKLTGYPVGGFQEKVTKRWPFAEAIERKKSLFRGKGKPPQTGPAATPSLAAFAEPKPESKPVPEVKLESHHKQEPEHGLQKEDSRPPVQNPKFLTVPSREALKRATLPSNPEASLENQRHPEENDPRIVGQPHNRLSLPAHQTARHPSISPHIHSVTGGFMKSGDSSIISMKRPSVVLPSLMEDEKYFHDLVKFGDLQEVKEFLKQRPEFNINCTNFQGVTALHIAVKSGNEELVHYLLEHPLIDIGDAALHAVKDNNIDILKMILEKQRSISPSAEFLACPDSAEFPDSLTPLILAAICGHYEMITILLDRGHSIPRPHKPRCFCKEECLRILQTHDSLSVSSGKLQIYKALCNPAYICNTTDDPILAAFKLSKELKIAGAVDSLFRKEYYELSEQTRIFTADLMNECRSSEEVDLILSEVPSSKISASYTFPRLILAMDYKQKEFVSSSNVQQVLEMTWVGNWYAWKGFRKCIKALYVIPRLLMLPFILVVLIVIPQSNLAKFYALPINKLLSSVASYGVFLLLIYIQSNVDKAHQTKESQPTGVEIFIVIYVVSYTWNSIRSIYFQGLRRFFKFGWNIYQVTMELLFFATFISWLTATMQAIDAGTTTLERKFWKSWDPELIAEGLFVAASIMAYLRVMMILQINYELGPLQVAIGKMTTDFAKYSVLMTVILISFTAALCKFYSYYTGMVQKDPETGTESKQEDSFTSTLETFKTLFWGAFQMYGPEVADVVIENLPDESGKLTVINEHHFTEAVGYITFSVYTVLMVIVVLNMLIATLSNTFQRIVDNVDSEWVFGKTEVYLQYINYPVLPPPFNLIPTTYGIKNCFSKSKKTYEELQDLEKGAIKEEKTTEDFHVLMAQLVQRYFNRRKDEEDYLLKRYHWLLYQYFSLL
ncbi:short transient receptor potential channel 4-like isoform X3 [Rhodnius prolixus]|uniref:short transient receptor potential channel 4-like isoform X3 n=1 Tax=Rhodnius prolixus TaxID=13249 RepID=UPI003D18B7F1